MRIRGRRIALLLAGALPLLAQDDVPNPSDWHEDEHDRPPERAAEALHDDSLSSLPGLPVDLMGENPNVEDGKLINEENLLENGKDEQQVGQMAGVEDPVQSGIDGAESGEPPGDGEGESSVDDRGSESEDQSVTLSSEKENSDSVEPEEAPVDDSSTAVEEEAKQEDSHQKSSAGEDKPLADEQKEGDAAATEETKSAATNAADADEEDEPSERLVVDYASKSAGALILEKSGSMKGTSNLLNADRDKYAIAPCEEKRFVVIGLSEDILVKQVRLANYERYSSQVKDFQIMGSQDMQTWADLGTYQAGPSIREQAFDLIEPSWARYLKFRFLSHHGSEHYCTVSQVKVHGSTMLQGFQEQWRESEGETVEATEIQQEKQATSAETNEEALPDQEGDNAHETAVPKTDSTTEPTKESPDASVSETEGFSKLSESGINDDIDDGSEEVDSQPSNSRTNGEEVSKESESPTMLSNADAADAEAPPSGNEADDSSDSKEDGGDEAEKQGNVHSEISPGSGEDGHTLGNRSQAHLPDALLDFQFPPKKSETLSLASIDVTAQKSATKEKPFGPEYLDPSAISPPMNGHGLKKLTPDESASDGARSSVVWEIQEETAALIKELQEKIKASLEGSNVGAAIAQLSSMSGHSDNDDVAEVAEIAKVNEGEHPSGDTDPLPVNASGTTDTEGRPSLDLESASAEQEVATNAEHEAERLETTSNESGSEVPLSQHVESRDDSRTLETVNMNLSYILKQFPSADCLSAMNFQEFKAKIVSAAAGTAGGSAGGPARMEPIFKTLTDEIKTLQLNQSANDQFTTALVSCAQRVLLDVSAELQRLHSTQETRLSSLEHSIQAMREERDRSVLHTTMSYLFGVSVASVLWMADVFQQIVSSLGPASKHTISLLWQASAKIARSLISVCGNLMAGEMPLCPESLCESRLVVYVNDEVAMTLTGKDFVVSAAGVFGALLVLLVLNRRKQKLLANKKTLDEKILKASALEEESRKPSQVASYDERPADMRNLERRPESEKKGPLESAERVQCLVDEDEAQKPSTDLPTVQLPTAIANVPDIIEEQDHKPNAETPIEVMKGHDEDMPLPRDLHNESASATTKTEPEVAPIQPGNMLENKEVVAGTQTQHFRDCGSHSALDGVLSIKDTVVDPCNEVPRIVPTLVPVE